MTEALHGEMLRLSKEYGSRFRLDSEFASILTGLYGEPQIRQLILNGRVDQKPADRNRINEDMQSSDVPLQIASFYRFLSERTRDSEGKGQDLAGDKDLSESLAAYRQKNEDSQLQVNEQTDLGRGVRWDGSQIIGINLKEVREWFNVDTIGRMQTLIGSPIQGVFIRGAVALTATMPVLNFADS